MNVSRPSVLKQPTGFTSPRQQLKLNKMQIESDEFKKTSSAHSTAFCSRASSKKDVCTPSLSDIMNERYNARLQ